ncbi:MAG: nitroreductase family protein [Acidimicrobiia bacterium]|nr:nitroreductase family protein [Acidimicrobiia bacterium]NNL27844.1 nitroreductase family protein [Acidimicrobiia bacterium]
MDFGDLLAKRKMVRSYEDRKVPENVLKRILDRATRHPSAGFSQGIHLIVVLEGRTRLAEAAGEDVWAEKGYPLWLSTAPVHIAICADPASYRDRYDEADKSASIDDWNVPYWWVDAGAALMLLLLASVDEGLSAGFLGAHAFDDLSSLLQLPVGVLPVGVATIGYGAPDPVVGSRSRPRLDTVHHESW